MFRDCLSSHGQSITESILEDVIKNISDDDVSVKLDSWTGLAGDGEKGDVALKNLEGGGEAIGLATQWITPDEKGLKRLQRIQEHLPESLELRLEKYIAWAKAKIQALVEERLKEESQARSERSEETEDDPYDDKGNTAHRIFARSSFTQSDRSFSAPVEGGPGFYTPVSSPREGRSHRRMLTASPTPPSSIFNQEYASWFTPTTPPKQRFNPLLKTLEPRKVTSVLSPSTTKVNTVRPPATSESCPEAPPNSAPQALLSSSLASTHSSASTSFTSSLSSSSTQRSSKTPPSPGTIARREKRRAEREERRRIALKLGRARPDLVTEEFTEKFFESAQELR